MPDTPVTRFVILAAPRTGSNMLCTLLNSHDDILCHHEIFNPADIFYALQLRENGFSLGSMEERERDPLEFLERVWRTPLEHSCVGFKMTHRQNEPVFWNVLNDPGVKKLVLRRNNRVKTFVSHSISDKTGQWEVYRQAELVRERPQVHVDLAALSESITVNENYYQEIAECLRASHQPFLNATYEDLFSPEEHGRILRFLGVSQEQGDTPVRLQVSSVKQNSDNLQDLISNYAELKAALRGTELEAELYGQTGSDEREKQ